MMCSLKANNALTFAAVSILALSASAANSPANGGASAPVFKSGIVRAGSVNIDTDISGAKSLWLVVTPGDDGFGCDWADWGEARLVGPKGEVKLVDLKWKQASSGFGEVRVNRNAGGQPLRIAGEFLADGIGTHAPSVIQYEIAGAGFTRFKAKAGLDNGGTDQGCGSTVEFMIFKDQPPTAYLAMARDAASGGGTPRGSGPDAAKADAERLITPDGLVATLFASEPMIVNPANMDIDSRGRVWITEGANYRKWAESRPGGDRIRILEDTNGDGVADSAKTFYQGTDVNTALGICVLGSKVIVSCSPKIMVFTDADGDDKADGPPQILFNDIKGEQHDHGAHAFVFGPDGKLYFNLGNAGRELKTPDKQYIFDKAGNRVTDDGKPYRQGMVFRCDPDGTNLETVGWNFRNNYEVCVDSFGTLWQSDNDDDGNRGVRINFVMEFGNYGYTDELTGKGWREPRSNMEKEIPLQHWHQNDPGVVPNLLQTGAGSPTGMCVYEGGLLPQQFRGQLIHCDAGPRTVRAYPAQRDGAGYKAEMVDILTSTDTWYRPSDVCVAPDGSLFVSDWNDAGVGGHNMADRELDKMRGRVYRVAPKGHKLTVPKLDLKTTAGCVAALQSPNQATRHLAWTELHNEQTAAEPELLKLWKNNDTRMRARALQLLARIKGSEEKYVRLGIEDSDPDIRITALRIARQTDWKAVSANGGNDKLKKAGLNTAFKLLGGALSGKKVTVEGALGDLADELSFDVIKCVNLLANDPSAAVRRECTLALRHNPSPSMPKLWAFLAKQHDGKDRWYLEALGIGADKRWDECLDAWLDLAGTDWNSTAGRDVIWRSRSAKTPELLTKLIKDSNVPDSERPRYFRAFDFQNGEGKQKALVDLAIWASAK